MTTQQTNDVLVTEITKAELPSELAESIMMPYRKFFDAASPLVQLGREIVITDASQKEEMERARAVRLKLKEIRCDAERLRKELKDGYLRTGKAIDGMANVLKAMIEPIEEHLQRAEDFVKNQERERLERILTERYSRIRALGANPELYQLSAMTEETFAALCSEIEEQNIRRAEAEKIQAEAEARAAREETERVERERKALEEKVRAERAKAAAEKEKAEEAARQAEEERAKRIALERAEVERKEEERRAEEAKAAAAAEEERALKNKAFKEFLKAHGITDETPSETYRVERQGNHFKLYTLAGEITI